MKNHVEYMLLAVARTLASSKILLTEYLQALR